MPQHPNEYLAGYSLVTPESLANFLRREFSALEQAQASEIISSIEIEIAARCNRQFCYALPDDESVLEAVEYIERFDLPTTTVCTSAFPVATVESIRILGEEQELEEDVDYFIYPSRIEFQLRVYSGGVNKRALEIEYTIRKFWGDDIRLLVEKMAGAVWLNAEDAGVAKTDISFAATRQVMDSVQFAKDIERVISRYRKRLV